MLLLLLLRQRLLRRKVTHGWRELLLHIAMVVPLGSKRLRNVSRLLLSTWLLRQLLRAAPLLRLLLSDCRLLLNTWLLHLLLLALRIAHTVQLGSKALQQLRRGELQRRLRLALLRLLLRKGPRLLPPSLLPRPRQLLSSERLLLLMLRQLSAKLLLLVHLLLSSELWLLLLVLRRLLLRRAP